jgi:EmrB/QacA subfamily drug resistance transporter
MDTAIAPAPASAAAREAAAFTPHQRLMLTLLCGSICMVVLDFSIVNVAVPSIQTALGFSAAGVQWLFTGYGLVLGGFQLLGGRLSDLYGRKRMYLSGIAIFVLASFLGGLAAGPAALVAMRCLQGLGAALLAPAALALLMGVFEEGPARNRAFGIWGTVAAAGYSIGVVLGGVLVASLGWRWILFVNVPVGILILAAAWRLLPDPKSEGPRPRLDILGSVLVTSGLMALVYALARAPETGWTAPSIWRMLGAAAALLGLFAWVEARSPEPLMPFRIFRMPGVAAANLIFAFMSAAMVAMNLVLTLHLQQVLGLSPLLTGPALLPHGLAATYAGPWGGRLAGRFGPRRVLMAGIALALASLLALGLFLSARNTYWYHVLPATVLLSFGAMPAFVTLTLLATAGAKPEEHGLVSGIVNTMGQLGGALGLAVLVAVAAGRTSAAIAAGLPQAEALIAGYRAALATGAGFIAVSLLIGAMGLRSRA